MKPIDQDKQFSIEHVMNTKNFFKNTTNSMKSTKKSSQFERKILVNLHCISHLSKLSSLSFLVESEKIRRELARFHDENIELTKQKDTLIITHDIQMKKLHETYSNKLREAEHWPDRLQTELKQQREQHRQQLIELEQRLTNNFTTVKSKHFLQSSFLFLKELNIEKQKNNNLLRKYEQDTDHSTQKLRHELISTEKVTIEQRQFYEEQIEQLKTDKNDLKKELDTVRTVLKELHEQTSKISI